MASPWRFKAGLGAAVAAVAVLAWAGICAAQALKTARPPGPPARKDVIEEGGGAVRITKLDALGTRNTLRTPQYQSDMQRGLNPAQEWPQIEVTFRTDPEWIDELVLQFHALSARRESDGRTAYSLYRATVRHADVERGRRHRSAVYLRPPAAKRFGDLVAAAVEILYEGKVVDKRSEASGQIPDGWWQDAKIVESKAVTVRDGYLLDRAKTPFALVNVDDYEAVR